MTEETRTKLNLLELTAGPNKPYITPLPKEGSIYDYKFVKQVCTFFLLKYWLKIFCFLFLFANFSIRRVLPKTRSKTKKLKMILEKNIS